MSFGVQCEQCRAFVKVPEFGADKVPDHFLVLTSAKQSMHFCSKRCAAVWLTNN